MKKLLGHIFILILIATAGCNFTTPISPGELIDSHSDLEGTANCTKCHVLGKYVSDEKCLDCHDDISDRRKKDKGYHSSAEVMDKSCTDCHSDHHGRDFDVLHFDTTNFEHSKTGYKLEDKHGEQFCLDCHKKDFIKESKQGKKTHTFMGLSTKCSACHNDFHDETLSKSCQDCHDIKGFSPAPHFDHDKTKFRLKGKHGDVKCKECHENMEEKDKKKLIFNNIEYAKCTDCHTDVHKGRFGGDCTKCHDENSFKEAKNNSNFNHSLTGYNLEGRHKDVKCNDCHKGEYTKPLKHGSCSDCHIDYHKGRFKAKNKQSDCAECHTVYTFKTPYFTLEQHNKTSFPLHGSHRAVACTACHHKTSEWKFDKIGNRCVDCHADIHLGYIGTSYYPQQDCKLCHSESKWDNVKFDHGKTGYKLEGKHAGVSCKSCHYRPENGKPKQVFKNQSTDCATCHADSHNGQFSYKGKNYCGSCHDFNDWKAHKFDHNAARFKLDGKHQNVACAKCHTPQKIENKIIINYRNNKLRCEDCH